MTYAIIGAGRMARAVLYDLLRDSDTTLIRVGDVDPARARDLCASFGDERLVAIDLDARVPSQLDSFLGGIDVCVSAASFSVNL